MDLKDICNEFLDETMELNDLPGIALGVLRGGDVFTGARGVRDIVTREPVKEDDIFHCASASKLFTSEAVLKLAEAGALDPEDRLCDILPALGEKLRIADKRYEEVRLFQILSHTAGIGDLEDYRWNEAKTGADALEEYVYSPEVAKRPLLWAPGEGGFRYSNIAYEILGHVIAEKSPELTGGEKISYDEFIRRFLMRPAGMDVSTMLTFERLGVPEGGPCPKITDAIRAKNEQAAPGWRPMVLPHEKAEDRSIVPVEYYPYTRNHGPSSTLTSNVQDMLKWAEINMKGFAAAEAQGDGAGPGAADPADGLLLHPETYRRILHEYAVIPNNGEKMGLGWFMRKQGTYRLYGHEGADDGFRSSFWICPQAETAIVLLCNLSGAPVKKLNRKLFDLLAQAQPS